MKKIIFTLFIVSILVSCKQEKQPNAQDIIDTSIKVTGGDIIAVSTIDFDFRDKHYKAIRNNGTFQLEREFKDSATIIKDVYTNTDFKRFVNNDAIIIHDSMAIKYTNSVNSVHYFSVLPYGLNDPAVNKTYVGEEIIKEKAYHKIKVTFNQENGGKDFEDVFLYWINTETNKMDYLAYSYITDGGGMRFREAYNERYVKGIRFVDYNNYKPINKDVDLLDLGRLFEINELKLLSKIETENVLVK
ncbi:MAG: deoxyribose-phosphate aldolase [Bacteroidetes bacterium]|nr:deoxyribose-phosphate aldolase [Bacteroidota bacterium]